eukprot:357169-Chlamydomonas_euryale.AAC.3
MLGWVGRGGKGKLRNLHYLPAGEKVHAGLDGWIDIKVKDGGGSCGLGWMDRHGQGGRRTWAGYCLTQPALAPLRAVDCNISGVQGVRPGPFPEVGCVLPLLHSFARCAALPFPAVCRAALPSPPALHCQCQAVHAELPGHFQVMVYGQRAARPCYLQLHAEQPDLVEIALCNQLQHGRLWTPEICCSELWGEGAPSTLSCGDRGHHPH